MKTCIGWMLCLTLALISIRCATLSQEGIAPCVSEVPDPAALHLSAVMQMDELLIIQRTADYLRARGEAPAFSETYMRLHYNLEAPAVLMLKDGPLHYAGDYLEVRLYQNPDGELDTCEECYVLYLAEDGHILGYRKKLRD